MKTQNIFPKEWIRFSPMVTMENRFAQNEELFRVQDLAVDEDGLRKKEVGQRPNAELLVDHV